MTEANSRTTIAAIRKSLFRDLHERDASAARLHQWRVSVISGGGGAIGKLPAGATITSASLFSANDATRPGFMVLRVKGPSRFHAEGRAPRVNRAFAEGFLPRRPRRNGLLLARESTVWRS